MSDRVSPRMLDSAFYAQSMDSLNSKWGFKKELPDGYELQTLLALSHFPELKEINLHFILRPAKIPMASRPKFWSLFRSREKWIFEVIISSESAEMFEPLLLKNLPFNTQVGIIAHELGHAAYFQNLNLWQLIKFGFKYTVDQDFRRSHERSTDEQVINHGLGWQLYDYAHFIRNNITRASPYYRSGHNNYMERFYLNDDEVILRMKDIGIYNAN